MKNHVFGWSFVAAVALACGCGSSSSSDSVSCYDVTGTGTSKTCSFESTTVSGVSCTAPAQPGSCPSTGLVGCCAMTVTSGGNSVGGGVCYYDESTAASEKSTCATNKGTWSTTAQ